jgi:hypothetical protein
LTFPPSNDKVEPKHIYNKEVKMRTQRGNPWTRWSATKLGALQRCPKYFEFEYVLRMQDEVDQGVQKVFGSAMHYMFDKFFSLKNGYKSLEKFIGAFRYHWLINTVKIKYKDRIRMRDPKDVQKYLAIGTNVLKKFWYENLAYRTGKMPMPQVEQHFNLKFKGHTVRGVIDRIQPISEDKIEIWDYKTGYKKPTPEELFRDIQFTTYNLAWFKKTGKNPDKMRLIHLFSGEHFLVPMRTEADYLQLGHWLDEAQVYIQNILQPQTRYYFKDFIFRWFNPEDIERGHFSKRPSSFCCLCDYEELCRQSIPQNTLKEHWIKQELAKTGPYPQHIQLELFFPKTKGPRLK